jgi:hypothetical protein
MKSLFYLGIACIVLGLLSLFIDLPYAERPSGESGSITVQSANNSRRGVSPYASGFLICGGLAMMIGGCRNRQP